MSAPRDLLDWTLTDAPEATSAPLPRRARGSPFSHFYAWRLWIGLGLTFGLIALSLWLSPVLNHALTQLALQQVVAAEEAALQARDGRALAELADPNDSTWLQAQLRQALNGFASPLPTRLLRPLPEAGTIQSFTLVTADVARVEVKRIFITASGDHYAFLFPQFYRYSDQWRRIAPLNDEWGAPQEQHGPRFILHYYPGDSEFIAALAPYLEAKAARACAVWRCPNQFQLTLNFLTMPLRPDRDLGEWQASDPALFALMPIQLTRYPEPMLYLQAPQAGGYPADEASAELLRRAIGVQVLFAIADELSFHVGGINQTGNAFFYALVTRRAAQLELDSPAVLAPFPADARPLVNLTRLWQTRFAVWRRPEEMRAALAALNHLLREQDPTTEGALFQTWPTEPNPEAWLANGLGISIEEAQAQWAEAVERVKSGE